MKKISRQAQLETTNRLLKNAIVGSKLHAQLTAIKAKLERQATL